jgi:hypothetical protein
MLSNALSEGHSGNIIKKKKVFIFQIYKLNFGTRRAADED